MLNRITNLTINEIPKSQKMIEAQNFLNSLGIEFRTVSEYQLKVGNLNFYTNGAVNRDGEKRLNSTGYEFWKEILILEGKVG